MSSGTMALEQPTPHPFYHTQGQDTVCSKPPRISRRASMEDYQRRIVDKIKRHLDRRRKQWESNLQKKAEVFNVPSKSVAELQESADTVSEDTAVSVPVSPLRTQTGDVDDSTETEMASLKVVCSRCIKQNKNKVSKWKFEIDINDFLPDGEVLISTEGKTLTATGHMAKRKSRGGSSLAVKMQLMLDGEVDCRSMRVTTSTTGVMTIEVTVTHDRESSR